MAFKEKIERLAGINEEDKAAGVETAKNFYSELPIPIKSLLVGLTFKFASSPADRQIRSDFIEEVVQTAGDTGEDSLWVRIPMWFMEEPTRTSAIRGFEYARRAHEKEEV